jgi:hypothetical protein
MNKYDSALFGDERFPQRSPADGDGEARPARAGDDDIVVVDWSQYGLAAEVAPPPAEAAAKPAESVAEPGDEPTGPDKAAPAAARRRLLGDDAKRILVSAISRGYTRREAAAFVGCHPRTIARERKRDPEFASALAKAVRLLGCEAKDMIAKSARTNWRAAAFLLKHMLVLEDRAERNAEKARQEKRRRKLAKLSPGPWRSLEK